MHIAYHFAVVFKPFLILNVLCNAQHYFDIQYIMYVFVCALWQIFDCVLRQRVKGHRTASLLKPPIAINISWCIEHARGTFV